MTDYRRIVIAAAAAFCLAVMGVVPASAAGPRFSIALKGGWTSVAGGDLTTIQSDWNAYLTEQVKRNSGTSLKGEYRALGGAWSAGADVIFHLSRRWGLSLGTDRLYFARGAGDNRTEIAAPYGTSIDTRDLRASAIPVRIGIVRWAEFSTKWRAFLTAGAGYYFAKISIDDNSEYPGGSYRDKIEARANGFGFHGGAGLEYNLTSRLALVFEAAGRLVRIKGFDGSRTHSTATGSYSEDGTLTYFEYEDFGRWFGWTEIRNSPADYPDTRDSRDTRVDFSGLGIRIGLRLSL